jgi:hypothetical protein
VVLWPFSADLYIQDPIAITQMQRLSCAMTRKNMEVWSRIVGTMKKSAGTRNIWVKKADEPFSAAKPMSAETKRPVFAYFWSRDAKFLLYAQDQLGDGNFNICH